MPYTLSYATALTRLDLSDNELSAFELNLSRLTGESYKAL